MKMQTHACYSMLSHAAGMSPDTDVAVLCIHFAQKIGTGLWFKPGMKDLLRCTSSNGCHYGYRYF